MGKISLGIDIGGSMVRGVLWNGRLIGGISEFKTPKTKKDFEKKISRLVKKLKGKKQIRSFGIGAPGIINGTTIRFAPNIPYLKNFDFQKLFSPTKVFLDNDARCFARAEMKFGAGKGKRSGLLFTIGTGIGRAYWERGSVQNIKKFEYPEQWERQYQRIRDRKNYETLSYFLAPKLHGIIKAYKPSVVVFGGGVMEKRGFGKKLKKALRTHDGDISIEYAKLPYAGVIGAAMLALRTAA